MLENIQQSHDPLLLKGILKSKKLRAKKIRLISNRMEEPCHLCPHMLYCDKSQMQVLGEKTKRHKIMSFKYPKQKECFDLENTKSKRQRRAINLELFARTDIKNCTEE